MVYEIEIAEKLEKRLSKLPKKDKEKILEKIDSLASNPPSFNTIPDETLIC